MRYMDTIRTQFATELKAVQTVKDVEALKVRYLGKKGLVAEQMKRLKDVSDEERPQYGKKVNDLRLEIEGALEKKLHSLESDELAKRLEAEHIDITLPGRSRFVGAAHPVTHGMEEMLKIFSDLGFSIQVGPEVDTDYYNFEVLNFPPDHPARDMQDTFYIEPGMLLRTHTSTIQARFLEQSVPPVRIVCPGRCFRNETISSRSHVFFHQIEGLCVDVGISMQDLVWTLTEFVQRLFGRDVSVRFRPSYFPFVEPGLELDISCFLCSGKGCALCKKTGWLEILGAGMIHPQVLKNVGIDPEKYTGFAWGMGIERSVMLRSGMKDIRELSENDMRFLKQFRTC